MHRYSTLPFLNYCLRSTKSFFINELLVLSILFSSIFFFPLLLMFSPLSLMWATTVSVVSIISTLLAVYIQHQKNADCHTASQRNLFYTFTALYFAFLGLLVLFAFIIAAVNSQQKNALSLLSPKIVWFCELSPPGLVASLI